MKKNLPYFIVIVALTFLIIGVLSTGREKPQSAPLEKAHMQAQEAIEQETSFSLVSSKNTVEAAQEQKVAVPSSERIFNIYTDSSAPDNHYAASGWMGDTGDIGMEEKHMDNPYAGTTCIKLTYSAKEAQGKGWAGVYWQNPPNNWGERMGGLDLTGYNKLTFFARGETSGEAIKTFKVGGIKGTYPDSLEVEMEPVVLTAEWKQYSINLVGQDLSYLSGGFCWVTSSALNPNGATFYLDNIRFEYEPGLETVAKTAQDMPFDVYTERSSISNHFIASGWMGDTGDLKIDDDWTADPHSGTTCIRITYSGKVSQGLRWAGVFWQQPENNWGQIGDAGFDLSGAKQLTFLARGETGSERIEEFKMGGISGDYPDSDVAGIGPVVLTPEWKQYTIDLGGKDLSYVIGGFCFATNVDVNPQGCVFYLDDIRYE
ncbi:MAG: hypothetical protein ISS43_03280 [Candidatus Omnitrophica bacterium]|nr:hypothetical protein [Candidatus Omnitrophota bacterium]